MNPTIGRVAARTTGLVALAAVLTACGSVQERVEERVTREVVEQALGDDVELREDGFSYEDEDGRQVDFGTNQLPEEWPSDLPVPDGGRVLSSVAQSGADGTEIATMIEFDGTLDDVRPEVQDALDGSAWTPDGDATSVNMDGTRAWAQTYVSGENRTSLSVVDSGEGTTVISWQVELGPTGSPAGSTSGSTTLSPT